MMILLFAALPASIAVTLAYVYKDSRDRWHYGHNDE